MGVKKIVGTFDSDDIVSVCAYDDEKMTGAAKNETDVRKYMNSEGVIGDELARGRINYSSHDMQQIIGKRSDEIASLLYGTGNAHHHDNTNTDPARIWIIERDNMVLLPHVKAQTSSKKRNSADSK